eukprot:jgi/Mesvir1/15595/Mv03206-RA.1
MPSLIPPRSTHCPALQYPSVRTRVQAGGKLPPRRFTRRAPLYTAVCPQPLMPDPRPAKGGSSGSISVGRSTNTKASKNSSGAGVGSVSTPPGRPNSEHPHRKQATGPISKLVACGCVTESPNGGAIHIKVLVKPGAKDSAVTGLDEAQGDIGVRLAAKPQDGEANLELVRVLADILGLPKGQVSLLHGGGKNRSKTAVVAGAERVKAEAALAGLLDPHRRTGKVFGAAPCTTQTRPPATLFTEMDASHTPTQMDSSKRLSSPASQACGRGLSSAWQTLTLIEESSCNAQAQTYGAVAIPLVIASDTARERACQLAASFASEGGCRRAAAGTQQTNGGRETKQSSGVSTTSGTNSVSEARSTDGVSEARSHDGVSDSSTINNVSEARCTDGASGISGMDSARSTGAEQDGTGKPGDQASTKVSHSKPCTEAPPLAEPCTGDVGFRTCCTLLGVRGQRGDGEACESGDGEEGARVCPAVESEEESPAGVRFVPSPEDAPAGVRFDWVASSVCPHRAPKRSQREQQRSVSGTSGCASTGNSEWASGIHRGVPTSNRAWAKSSSVSADASMAWRRDLASRKGCLLEVAHAMFRAGQTTVGKRVKGRHACPRQVPRVSNITRESFREIFLRGQPVVLSGLDLGPCVARWRDLDYLVEAVGTDRVVRVHVCAVGQVASFGGIGARVVDLAGHRPANTPKNFAFVDMGFGEFVARCVAAARAVPCGGAHQERKGEGGQDKGERVRDGDAGRGGVPCEALGSAKPRRYAGEGDVGVKGATCYVGNDSQATRESVPGGGVCHPDASNQPAGGKVVPHQPHANNRECMNDSPHHLTDHAVPDGGSGPLGRSNNNLRECLYLRSVVPGKGKEAARTASDVRALFPGLAGDLNLFEGLLYELEEYHSSVLRVTSARTQLWTHYDIMDNVLTQVVGCKRVVLFPPSEEPHMYVEGSSSRVDDIDAPDLSRFPLFERAMATAVECVASVTISQALRGRTVAHPVAAAAVIS